MVTTEFVEFVRGGPADGLIENIPKGVETVSIEYAYVGRVRWDAIYRRLPGDVKPKKIHGFNVMARFSFWRYEQVEPDKDTGDYCDGRR